MHTYILYICACLSGEQGLLCDECHEGLGPDDPSKFLQDEVHADTLQLQLSVCQRGREKEREHVCVCVCESERATA